MADKEKAADKEAAATSEGTESAPKESKIAPKPEGFESPYNFTKLLNDHLGKPREGEGAIRPQTVYAMVRSQPKLKDGTPFPVEQNTDGHYMVNVAAGIAWYDARQKERAESKAAKAAKAESGDKEAAAEG